MCIDSRVEEIVRGAEDKRDMEITFSNPELE
jgi:hypothetical protein